MKKFSKLNMNYLQVVILAICVEAFFYPIVLEAHENDKWHPVQSFNGNLTQDLPPIGRSVFDYLLAKESKSVDKLTVPYPFEKLLELIDRNVINPKPNRYSLLAIPFGRSLQRFAASENPFKYPRILVAVNRQSKLNSFQIPLDMQSKLYIGYVEPSNMLEVISFNEAAARFEFQIVKNYKKGSRPEVYYAPRQLCITCHEGELPIFPTEPWTETNDNKLLAEQIIKARGEKHLFGHPIDIPHMPGRGFSDQASKFDFDILESGKKGFSHRMLDKICPPSKSRPKCLATGVKLALSTQMNYWKGPNWELILTYKKIMTRYYQKHHNLAIPVPFLPDRDPFTNLDVFGLNNLPPTTAWPKENFDSVKQKLLKNITFLPERHDPKLSRMQITKNPSSACLLPVKKAPIPYRKYCSTHYFLDAIFSGHDVLYVLELYKDKDQYDVVGLFKLLDNLQEIAEKQNAGPFATRFLQRELFLKAFIQDRVKGAVTGLCCDKVNLPKPQLLEEGISKNQILNNNVKLMFELCDSCHNQPNIDYPIQFLYGKTEAGIIRNISKNAQNILGSLKGETLPMPPKSSTHARYVTPAKKKNMIKFVEKLAPKPQK